MIRILTLTALLAVRLLVNPEDRQPIRALIAEIWKEKA